MISLTLADLVSSRAPITPREAATLTMAVAREWDRQRARRGPIALPALDAIRLEPTGEVSFLVTPPTCDADEAATLSALLGRLLGLDDERAPRQHIPGGLLITICGRLGEMALPSTTREGFRDALARFADPDPAMLRSLVERARTVERRLAESPRRSDRPASSPERRKQPAVVAALRREVRDFERESFESQRRALARARVVAATLLAVACLVLVLGFSLRQEWATPAGQVSEYAVPPRPAVTTVPLPVSAVPAEPVVVSSQQRSAVTRAKAPRHPRTAVPHDAARRRPTQAFAGGTRAISWLATN